MTIRATYDPVSGRVTGLYDTAINGDATPPPWIAINSADRVALLANGSAWRVDAGALAPALTPADLPVLRARALRQVEATLERMATPFTAGVPVIELFGWEVRRAAASRIDAGAGTAEDAALIAAETLLTGETEAARVAAILGQAQQQHLALATMSGIRRAAAAAIAAAAAPEDITAAVTLATGRVDAFLASLEG